jgi:hypothetical protein
MEFLINKISIILCLFSYEKQKKKQNEFVKNTQIINGNDVYVARDNNFQSNDSELNDDKNNDNNDSYNNIMNNKNRIKIKNKSKKNLTNSNKNNNINQLTNTINNTIQQHTEQSQLLTDELIDFQLKKPTILRAARLTKMRKNIDLELPGEEAALIEKNIEMQLMKSIVHKVYSVHGVLYEEHATIHHLKYGYNSISLYFFIK